MPKNGTKKPLLASMPMSEQKALAKCEKVIETGKASFVKVGLALLEIRDKRLYRADHGTFQDYAEKRWGFGRNHALRLIGAAEVATEMQPAGLQIGSEREARQLAADVLGGSPTAAALAAQLKDMNAEQKRVIREQAEKKALARAQAPSSGGRDLVDVLKAAIAKAQKIAAKEEFDSPEFGDIDIKDVRAGLATAAVAAGL